LRKDCHKTDFSILGDKYEFLRLPFGLKNAPFFFQKTMYRILSKFNYVKVFIDDILIYSKNINEHYEHLNTILKHLLENNVSINPEKCHFAKESVKFLGYEINENGYCADTSRVEKFDNFKPPTSKKKIMSLVGTLQWFRPFVPNMSKKLLPITDKLKLGTFT
ncbi:putative LTR transposable element, partial [Pseudoloma neurophilia]